MSKFTENWKKIAAYKQDDEFVTEKAAGDCYTVRVNGGLYAQYLDKSEAQTCIDMLRAQGTYGVMVKETIVGETAKAAPLGDWNAGPGKEVNLCVEYTDHNGSVQYRFFNTDAEMKQWKQEMNGTGLSVKSITPNISKHIIEKPAKFDRCVEHVKQNNPGANAYAVCNAVLSEKAIYEKSAEYCIGLLDLALAKFGIAGAGPIPESKLARQDLEGTTSKTQKSIAGFTSIYELTSRIKSNQKPTRTDAKSFKDFWNRITPTNKL